MNYMKCLKSTATLEPDCLTYTEELCIKFFKIIEQNTVLINCS
jgi:hypothetical protein